MQLTYNEIVDVSNVIYIAGSIDGYTVLPGLSEIIDFNSMLNSLLPKVVKVNFTKDVIRLKSNLTSTTTIKFNKKSFFCTLLGFTQSYSGPLAGFEGFIQLIPGSYKSDTPVNLQEMIKFI